MSRARQKSHSMMFSLCHSYIICSKYSIQSSILPIFSSDHQHTKVANFWQYFLLPRLDFCVLHEYCQKFIIGEACVIDYVLVKFYGQGCVKRWVGVLLLRVFVCVSAFCVVATERKNLSINSFSLLLHDKNLNFHPTKHCRPQQ
jgi:hypothetical protein